MPNPLLDAIKNEDYSQVFSILSQNPEYNSSILNKEYSFNEGFVEEEVSAIPLHLATFLLNPDIVQLLLKQGAEPNIRSVHFDSTALDWVTNCDNISDDNVISKKLQIIDLLFYYGAVVNDFVIEKCISTSVELAYNYQKQAFFNNNKMIATLQYHKVMNEFLLLVRQGNVKEVLSALNKTYCVKHPYIDFTLYEFKVNLDYDGGVYGTAILYAAEFETPDMLKLLFKNGANLNAIDLMGNNVFHYAARSGRVENIVWLFNDGLSNANGHCLINASNKTQGNTPLHFAAKYGYVKTVDTLLALGAVKNNKNFQNKTAQELSSKSDVREIFRMYPEGQVPKLIWLAAKACGQSSLKSQIQEVEEHINLVTIGKSLPEQASNNTCGKKRKRSNSI